MCFKCNEMRSSFLFLLKQNKEQPPCCNLLASQTAPGIIEINFTKKVKICFDTFFSLSFANNLLLKISVYKWISIQFKRGHGSQDDIVNMYNKDKSITIVYFIVLKCLREDYWDILLSGWTF